MPALFGDKHGRSKLTAKKVLMDRRVYQKKGFKNVKCQKDSHHEGRYVTILDLAVDRGVEFSTMQNALTGKTWKHVPLA